MRVKNLRPGLSKHGLDLPLVHRPAAADDHPLRGGHGPPFGIAGDPLVAGSVNLDGVIEMEVEKTGNDTTLGTIHRLSERARYARPEFVQIADRIASYIVVALLAVATAVAVYWYIAAPGRAFVITLSVLVVTCPCALALATPAALASAASALRVSATSIAGTPGERRTGF